MSKQPERSEAQIEANIASRRAARARYAGDRIDKILAGSPPLTDQQIASLQAKLAKGRRDVWHEE